MEVKDSMNQEDEIKIIQEIRKGNKEAKESFIKQNQGLVIYLAKRYAFSSDILADLIAEGNMGLLKALEKFDFRKKVKFGTYAYFWIKRFILRAVMKEFEVLKIPERYQEFKEKLEEIRKDYMFNQGRMPTDKEIAEGLKLAPEIVKKLKKYSNQVRVISSGFYDGEKEIDLFEVIDFEKHGEPGLWEVLNNRDILVNIFSRLKNKKKRANIQTWIKVLELYYGLGEDGIQYSYKEISAKLKISRQRVHQIKKVALKKLKKEWKEIKHERTAIADKDNT